MNSSIAAVAPGVTLATIYAMEDDELGNVGSLMWLWRTVGATCCWAISDVICDACIRSVAHAEDKKEVQPTVVASSPAAPPTPLRKRPMQHSQGNIEPACNAENLHDVAARCPPRSPLSRPSSILLDDRMPQALGLDSPVRRQLTPEQNAFVSGCISLLTFAVATTYWTSAMSSAPEAALFAADGTSALAALGGCFHFAAYLSTLCAYGSVSSTVITPLMQLSAVWMLPFSTLAAALGLSAFIRPVHLLSVALICAGGFLPAARGSLSLLASQSFWQQSAVRYVVLGELLICFYNVLMHQATFGASSGTDAAGISGLQSSWCFFLVSRAANGLTCTCLFFAVPSLRCHALALRKVDPWFLIAACLGECLSMLGVCLVTFSYSAFYEPSVVNAVEGGLQQLFNLLFAVVSYRVLGWGRDVDQVPVKCISFLLVALGLTLSTM
eukprot:CAMPEP_0197901290 /NCGR_PEP_ID=MMETSP1439-20131203/50922_1 /TAXON_ID=66791 /ORGANISM="Gonyaulax spinifera, Strain CCMP409" /LENGTH=440 /DNA_ID=CAMNT_0043522255 /DNA_START=68 /DNA_END=1390 /DNA_ORIENTATION=+